MILKYIEYLLSLSLLISNSSFALDTFSTDSLVFKDTNI